MTNLLPNATRRRSRARHVRGGHRRGLQDRVRRRGADRPDRLDRRHGRQRHGDDERRHRCGRLDPREQGRLQHPRRQLLAAVDGRRAASCTTRSNKAVEKLWFSGVVVVAAAGNYGDNGQPTTVAYAPGNDPVRDHRRRERHERHGLDRAQTTPRLRGRPSATPSTASRSPTSALPAASSSARCLPRLTMPLEHPERVTALRLHVDVRNVVLGSGRLGRGGPDPGQEPELDAGQGQGRAHADRTADGRRSMALGVGEVNAKGAFDVIEPAQPEPRPERIRRPGRHRAARPSTRPAGRTRPPQTPPGTRRAGTAPPGPGVLGQRLLERGQLGPGLLDQASWSSASWNAASWAAASWAAASWNAASWAAASWAA